MDKKNETEKVFERKEKLVLKEFDTGFSAYQKSENKIGTLRQWTITINVAFVFYVLEKCERLIPILTVIFLFMFIIFLNELRGRASMHFDKINILDLERIFNLKDQKLYEKEIIEYRFRDEVISNISPKTKISHYWNSIYKGEVILWYEMWIVVWIVLIFIKRWNTIFTRTFTLNQIGFIIFIFIILSITILVILRYFKKSWRIKWSWKKFRFTLNRINVFYKKARKRMIYTKRIKKNKR